MDFVHPVEAAIPGVQGRVLEVLVDTAAELSLRTLARLAGVSAAQASRVLPGLVELGLVERREVPPSSQFRLVRSRRRCASEVEQGRFIAATSLAVHAAINAADAVGGARLGMRAAGEDHDQVPALPRQAGVDGTRVETDLRRLLPLEAKAEYDSDDIAPTVATEAVERVQRCVLVARSVVGATRSGCARRPRCPVYGQAGS